MRFLGVDYLRDVGAMDSGTRGSSRKAQGEACV